LYSETNCYFSGTLAYYVDGKQVGTIFNDLGQIPFHTNLDRIRLGYFLNSGLKNGLASLEFYLRPLSQPEIAAAMTRSKSFPLNPTCNAE
jgi:hypothetical protein